MAASTHVPGGAHVHATRDSAGVDESSVSDRTLAVLVGVGFPLTAATPWLLPAPAAFGALVAVGILAGALWRRLGSGSPAAAPRTNGRRHQPAAPVPSLARAGDTGQPLVAGTIAGSAVRNHTETALAALEARVEEVGKALLEDRTVTAILRKQLATVTAETGDAAVTIVERLRAVQSSSQAMLARLGETNEGAGVFAVAWRDEATNGLRRMRASVDDRLQATRTELAAVTDEIGSLLGLVHGVQALAHRTGILAINAAIESSRGGEGSNGFRIIATEVRDLAERSSASATAIADGIRTLTRNIERSIDRSIENTIAGDNEALTELERSLERMGSQLHDLIDGHQEVLSRARTDNRTLNDQVMDILAGIQFQDVTRQQLEGVARGLDLLDEQREDACRQLQGEGQGATSTLRQRLDRLMADYTSNTQRRDHAKVTGAAGPAGAPAIELF